jgi:hypothetical protein
MYSSGSWRGFWQQDGFGRQSMEQFTLAFHADRITGHGVDIIGPFRFDGRVDSQGHVQLIKRYLGRHTVIYTGEPDGEGSILGTWSIEDDRFGISFRGPFLMQPVRDIRAAIAEPIRDLAVPSRS